MKRSAPLQRKTPLVGRKYTCKHCGNEFIDYYGRIRRYCSMVCVSASQRHDHNRICEVCGYPFKSQLLGARARRSCSDKCNRELRRRSKLGKLNPQYKHGKTPRRHAWYAARESACRCCGSSENLKLHHVVYEQHVRKYGGDEWDLRNGLTVCLSCHSRHHNGTDAHIPISDLRPENIAFAVELLGEYAQDYFFRYYHAERDEIRALLEAA